MRLAQYSTFRCPFCGEDVHVGEILEDGDTRAEDVGGVAVMHYQPHCDVFVSNEPEDYISAALGRAQSRVAGGAS